MPEDFAVHESNLAAFAAQYGGIVDLNLSSLPWVDIASRLQKRIDRHVGRLNVDLYPYTPCRLRFCFTNELQFNARAGRFGTTYCVAITIGTLAKVLHHVRWAVLSGCTIAPSDREVSDFEEIPTLDLLQSNALFEISSDWNDRYLISNIVTCIVETLFFHEVAHLLRGHVDWTSDTFKFGDLDEVSLRGRIPDVVAQTLEWDADCFAFHTMICSALGLTERLIRARSRRYTFPPQGDYGPWNGGLTILSIAAYILLRMHESESPAVTHPPSWFRFQLYYLKVSDTIEKEVGIPHTLPGAKYAVEILVSGGLNIERIWTSGRNEEPILERLFEYDRLVEGQRMGATYFRTWPHIESQLLILRPDRYMRYV